MKKTLISIAAIMALPAVAHSADVKQVMLEGFVDIVWTASDGTDLGVNGSEGHFATSGELDMKTQLSGPISLRMDADLGTSTTGGDSAELEQAYLGWAINNELSLKAGVFNNNLTLEKEDAPDLYQVTHGQLWDIWNTSTAEAGNNLQGVELSYKAGDITAFVGFLNDMGAVPEENSIKMGAEIRAIQNMTLTAGLVTQDAGVENIIDVNALWNMSDKLTLGGEIMLPSEFIDMGLMVMANFKVDDKFSGTARFDMVSYDVTGADDTTSITLAGLYAIENNLFANAEIRINSDDNGPPTVAQTLGIGEGDGTTVHLELLATF